MQIIVAFSLLAVAAAASDLAWRRVSNRMNLAILGAGLIWQLAAVQVVAPLLGVAVGLAMLLPAFAMRWVGGGDVKLLAAFGAWLGPAHIAWAGLLGIALGGALSLGIALAGGIGGEVAGNLRAAALTLTTPTAPRRGRALVVPLAVPLATTAALVFAGVL